MKKISVDQYTCLSAPARILSLVDERPTGPIWKASEAANTSASEATFMILYVLTPNNHLPVIDVCLDLRLWGGEKK